MSDTSTHLDIAPVPEEPAISPLKESDAVRTADDTGQWILIWHKFKGNKVAVFAGCIVLALYCVGAFAEFLAPTLPDKAQPRLTYAPPQPLAFFV